MKPPARENQTIEQLWKKDKMCKTQRLNIRFTTWTAFKESVAQVNNDYGDKCIHGEIVVELQ